MQISSLKIPTNQKFGWFFSVVFALLCAYFFWKSWIELTIFAFTLAIFFSLSALFVPQILSPFNRLWYGFGLLLGRVVSPIVLGVIFFLLITPVSLVTRLFGRDELRMKKSSVESYWVDRLPPGPPSDSFNNQY
jgi:hypothetical protein